MHLAIGGATDDVAIHVRKREEMVDCTGKANGRQANGASRLREIISHSGERGEAATYLQEPRSRLSSRPCRKVRKCT